MRLAIFLEVFRLLTEPASLKHDVAAGVGVAAPAHRAGLIEATRFTWAHPGLRGVSGSSQSRPH